MSEHFPEMTGWQLTVRVMFACGVTLAVIVGAIAVAGVVAAGILYVYWNQAVPVIAMAINYVRYMSAPAGTLVTETASPAKSSEPS